jgi:hypothetical protein
MVHELECSVEFGGGLSYELDDILTVFFEARYAHAISNTWRQRGGFVSITEDIIGAGIDNGAVYRNKGFIVLFGFTLPL